MGVREGGRAGREGGMERGESGEGWCNDRARGSDDVGEGGSGSGGREGRLRKGTSEEGASGGSREQRSEGEEKGRSVGGREIGREVNVKGGIP